MESNDSGEITAKHGLLFQGCVTAYHITRTFRGKTIRNVRYGVTDDIDIVSDGYINFAQVKNTGETRWNISDIVQSSEGADKKTIPCSSISHKSMQYESGLSLGRKYSIIAGEKVNKTLGYLTISPNARLNKSDRRELIGDLNKHTDNFLTSSGMDVSDWIDAATWEVFSSLCELGLLGVRNI